MMAIANWTDGASGLALPAFNLARDRVVDILLLLVQEARNHTEGEGVDGLDIAKAGLFSICDYEEKLRIAKSEYRARKRK